MAMTAKQKARLDKATSTATERGKTFGDPKKMLSDFMAVYGLGKKKAKK